VVQVGAQAVFADQDLVAPGGVGQAAGDVGRHAQQFQAADDGVTALHQHQAGVDAAVQAQLGVAAARAEAAQRGHLRCSCTAASTARRLSPSRGCGQPKMASMPSPWMRTSVPPCAATRGE
jgi:hypothetical protein